MVFRALLRCLRRSLERFKEKRRLRRRGKDHDTRLGADMDLEEAITAQLALQARAGRSLSSTESIAAAIRQSQQRRSGMPSFGTLLENEGKEEDPDLKAAVMDMQSLTPRFMVNGKQDESPASILNTSAATTTAAAEDEGGKEDLSASQGPIPRRSSIFNPRKEWI
jgi:hypothetical protein